MNNKIYIYYHADLDGLVSAFLFKRLLKQQGFDGEYAQALDYTENWQEEWTKFEFKKPFVIVDFLYHPEACGWFDHHQLRQGPADPKTLDWYGFDGSAPSTASVILKYARENRINLGNVGRVVEQTSIVDSAKFAEAGIKPAEVIFGKKKFLNVAQITDEQKHNIPQVLNDWDNLNWWENIQGEVFGRWLEVISKKQYITSEADSLNEKAETTYNQFKQYSRLEGKMVVYDMTSIPFERYMPALVYPGSIVFAGKVRNGERLSVKINLNPWVTELLLDKQGNQVNLGLIAKKFGGGGHMAVGSINVATEVEADEVLERVITYILMITNNTDQT